MKLIMRGTVAHILLQENTEITEIIQDLILHPPEKYSMEIHMDKNGNVASIIVLEVGASEEKLHQVLRLFADKYRRLDHPKYEVISRALLETITSLGNRSPLYPRNLFRLDKD